MRWLVGLLYVAVAVACKPYENHVLVDIFPMSDADVETLWDIRSSIAGMTFWEAPREAGRPAQAMLTRDLLAARLTPALTQAGIGHAENGLNIQQLVDENMAEIIARREASGQPFDIDNFNSLSDINQWLVLQMSNCPDGVSCELRNLGQSSFENDIWAFSMSTGSNGGVAKQSYMLVSAIHSAEWLAPATNLKVLNQFLTNYGTDVDTTALLDQEDFVFVIIANPDGYYHSWNQERLWDKNRASNFPNACDGVDLDLNFDFRWGLQGGSADPCDDMFRGPSANSELETQAIANELVRVAGVTGQDMRALVSLHSPGSYWTWSWANTVYYNSTDSADCETTPDYNDLWFVAQDACTAVADTNNQTRWACDTFCREREQVTGVIQDYTKGSIGAKYTYSVGLRGASVIISADQIEPSFQEFWAGMKAMVNRINIRES